MAFRMTLPPRLYENNPNSTVSMHVELFSLIFYF